MKLLTTILIIATLSLRAWAASMVDPTFDPGPLPDNAVEQVLELPDGHVLVCGPFVNFGGERHPFIVRLNQDGSIDHSFQTLPDKWTRHMAIQPDGKIVIAGFFNTINGVSRNLIARLDPDGTLDPTFNPGLGFQVDLAADIYGDAQPDVMWVELQPDGKILAAGDFRQYDSASANGFVRINPDGSRDTTFQIGNGLNSWGRFIRVLPDNKIILTGWFTSYNGQSFNRIVKLFPDGTPDHSLNANYGDKSAVYAAVSFSDGKFITAGHSLNTNFTREVVRLNPDGSFDPAWVGTTNEKTESLLLQSDGKVIAGGYFWLANGSSQHGSIVRWNKDGTVDETFNAQADDLVWTVAPARNNRILVSGAFRHIDGIARGMVARLILPEAIAQSTGGDLTITTPRINNGGFECTVSTATGYNYALQFKSAADASAWTSLDPVPGTGSPITLSDPNPTDKRFYRVQATSL